MNGTETPSGRLGAVLSLLGEPGPAALSRFGPWVVTTLEHARTVLGQVDLYDFPLDTSRRPLNQGDRPGGGSRSPHSITPPLAADAVARGVRILAREMGDATSGFAPGAEFDAMTILRQPIARSTVAAVLPDVDSDRRAHIGDLVLAWIDALAPVISRSRPPGRWSRTRKNEISCRRELEVSLAEVGCSDPPATGTLLAAGTQVPVAAGAWLLVLLATHPDASTELRRRPEVAVHAVWETLRVRPPTWITGRITTAAVRLGEAEIPVGSVVMVSPLLLGRLESLAPGPRAGAAPMTDFDPSRWEQNHVRPGAWLPFGAGPHACPGRNLGLAQLTHLAGLAREWSMEAVLPVAIDQSRGIFPRPSVLRVVGANDPELRTA